MRACAKNIHAQVLPFYISARLCPENLAGRVHATEIENHARAKTSVPTFLAAYPLI
jgi:hypothetical protein